jgi:O-antigen ligase
MASGGTLTGRREAGPARVALLVCGALVTLPFLFPEHELPIRSFYDEWLAFALATAVVAALLVGRGREPTPVPEISLAFFALAAWIGVQPLLRPAAYTQVPLYGVVYLVMAGALAWSAQRLVRELGAEAFCDTLAAFLLGGAVLNAAIGIVQTYGVPQVLEGIVARRSGVKAVGHVAQSNLYALYLALGQASLVYLLLRGRMRVAVAVLAALMLAYAAALSQSRSAVMFIIGLAVLAWFARGSELPAARLRRASLALALAVAAAIALLPRLHEWLGIPILHPFQFDRMVITADPSGVHIENRLRIWPFTAALAWTSPLVGVGWGQFALAAFRAGLPPTMAGEGDIWSSPHNLFLQLFVEGGLPAVAIALVAALRWWLPVLVAMRRQATLALWWLVAAAAILSLHSLVEYPFWFAHFLAAGAIALGAASPRNHALAMPRVAPAIGVGIVLVLAGVLMWTLRDYQRFAQAHWTATGRTIAPPAEVAAAIGTLRDVSRGPLAPRAEPWLFRSLPMNRDDLDAKVAMGRRVLVANPDARFIARQAVLLALAGEDAEARALVAQAARTLVDAPERMQAIFDAVDPTERRVVAPLETAAAVRTAGR